MTGSGYKYFKEKCREVQHEVIGNTITLDDIIDALILPDEVRMKHKKEKTSIISNRIEKENIILFIDDFHLADRNVRELVRETKGVVTASRRRVGIARNELPLFGIEEKDREDLIKLVTRRLGKEISDDAKEKIKNLAEGHPVSTEILVRNYEKINFQELEDYKYGLDFSNPEHVEEFLKRVLEEALSEESFSLLKGLSVINTDLESNLNKATIGQAYAISNFDEVFAELVDAGMLKKKEEKEGIYQFSYRHIQEAIRDQRDKESHGKAIGYYMNKIKNFGKTDDDFVEVLFHDSKSNPDEKSVDAFVSLSGKMEPIHYGFKRLIDVGEVLRNRFEDENKASVSGMLGNLYSRLKRFEEAEKALKEALKIRKELVKKNPGAYSSYLLETRANIGILYVLTNRTSKGVSTLKNVLKLKDLLSDFGARCFEALGIAHEKLQNPKDAAQNYLFASANHFLLLTKGVRCLERMLFCLRKVIELGDGEVRGDAELMLTAMRRLAGQEADIPEFPLSRRGKALKEALNGRKVEFHSENEIDSMVLTLIKEVLSRKS